jgi:hypothetical protein
MYALTGFEKRHQSLSAFAVSGRAVSQRRRRRTTLGDEAIEHDGLVRINPPAALDRRPLAGVLIRDLSSFRRAGRQRSDRTGSRSPTRDHDTRRAASAGPVVLPNRERVRPRPGRLRIPLRHSRCVRFRFSRQPWSSSS